MQYTVDHFHPYSVYTLLDEENLFYKVFVFNNNDSCGVSLDRMETIELFRRLAFSSTYEDKRNVIKELANV